jgi:23S rRNA (adenine2503-C2)-methyltransferase
LQTKLTEKQDIKDLTGEALIEWLKKEKVAPYRAGQILRWIYSRQIDSFDDMTDLGKGLRCTLASQFSIDRFKILQVDESEDGSRKYLFGLRDGNCIESALIPERGHFTLCISSQVGCALGCRFCLTGKGGLVRNLSVGEILTQVRDIQNDLEAPEKLTNIVFMGMGEPLANDRNVITALNFLTDTASGFSFAGRRITLSTAGLVPKMNRIGEETTVNLAVSLNATDNNTRDRLMPINKRYPIEQLLAACRRYPLKPHRRITFEYILMKDINDSEADAHRLVKLLRPLKAKVNLIPFNAYEGASFQRPDESVIERFQHILLDANYTVIIRRSKGGDISAACGQLRGRLTSDI